MTWSYWITYPNGATTIDYFETLRLSDPDGLFGLADVRDMFHEDCVITLIGPSVEPAG